MLYTLCEPGYHLFNNVWHVCNIDYCGCCTREGLDSACSITISAFPMCVVTNIVNNIQVKNEKVPVGRSHIMTITDCLQRYAHSKMSLFESMLTCRWLYWRFDVNRNANIFIQDILCEIAAILSLPPWVKTCVFLEVAELAEFSKWVCTT